MFTRPDDIDDAEVLAALARGWGFEAAALEYLAVGFGSHHWLATDIDGVRRFVTVDDLRRKWGRDEDDGFERLDRAFKSAHALRHVADLGFVHAPLPAVDGGLLVRVTPRYSMAVLAFLDGTSPAGGEYESDEQRVTVLGMLADLHRSTQTVASVADRQDLELPSREGLEEALAALEQPWHGGPFSEPARDLLCSQAAHVPVLLDRYDELVRRAKAAPGRWVITHGEPHAQNAMVTPDGLVLVDWDTTLIAPPERDLWMVVADEDDPIAAAYIEATGTAIDPDQLTLYRMWWDLSEIGGYVSEFRAPHTDSDNAREAWKNLRHFIRIDERWPA